MAFDISVANNLHASQEGGEEVEILHPTTREATGWFVRVRSDESRVALGYARKAIADGYKTVKGEAKIDAKVFAEISDQKAAALIAGWRGLMDGKAEVEYSEDKALDFVTKWPWFKTQIEDFAGVRENFMKP